MKIQIKISNLRLRADHTTKSASPGYAKSGIHDVLDTYQGSDYKWYKIKDGWVAGIPGDVVEVAEASLPEPVAENKEVEQIYVGAVDLRIRDKGSTTGAALGWCQRNSYYNVYGVTQDAYYTWYKIGDNAWCAGVEEVKYYPVNAWVEPIPVDADKTKNQVYIGDIALNIRKDHTTSSERMGVCQRNVNYNVLSLIIDGTYSWYQIGENAWVAGVDGVIFYQKGDSRVGPELKQELKNLQSKIPMAIKTVDNNLSSELYDQLLNKVKDINRFIENNFDPFDYDLVDGRQYNEIDLLYTTDVHGAWVGYDTDGNYSTPIFSYKDIGNYRDALERNNIKALLVDCGDWSRPCRAYNDFLNTGVMVPAQQMKNQRYFATTYGNHEWRWSVYGEANTEYDILDKMAGTICACNLYKNGKLVYRPYKTAKIGDKKIAVIGIGYPSANGTGSYHDGVWSYGEYQFEDGEELFKTVQKYIDLFKENGFDYIVAICHMCKSTYENDSRYNARTDSLIKNTSGLTAVIQGHYNFATNAEIIKDKKNNSVLLAHEAGANLNSFGRLQLKDDKVTSYLLDERSDLSVI